MNFKHPILSPSLISRYSRQIRLPNVGLEGQEKLALSKVLIIGMGGLGSPASLYLAAAGIGTIGIVDFDIVEDHNLQRQIIHGNDNIGESKISSAKVRLNNLNPDCEIIEHSERISADNAVEIFSNYDIIVDGSDNFPTRYLVNDAAYFTATPLVYGSVFQFEGQVSLFNPKQGGACYRCLYPKMPTAGEVQNCDEAGVLGALCGVIGSLQAMEAIKFILQVGENLIDQLFVIDALTMRNRTIKLKKDKLCPLCNSNPQIKDIVEENYQFKCQSKKSENVNEKNMMSDVGEQNFIEIEVEEAKKKLDTETEICLIDVREPFETEICRVDSSRNIPLKEISDRCVEIPKDQTVMLYCHHGMRSQKAAEILVGKGFKNVYNIKGGIDQWAVKIDPELKRY